jgi:hypothetical protein
MVGVVGDAKWTIDESRRVVEVGVVEVCLNLQWDLH